MTSAKYAFMSAYLKGAEAKIVTSEHIDRMSKTSSIQDVLEIIKDTSTSTYLSRQRF